MHVRGRLFQSSLLRPTRPKGFAQAICSPALRKSYAIHRNPRAWCLFGALFVRVKEVVECACVGLGWAICFYLLLVHARSPSPTCSCNSMARVKLGDELRYAWTNDATHMKELIHTSLHAGSMSTTSPPHNLHCRLPNRRVNGAR